MTNTNLVDSLFSKRASFEAAILCSYGLDLNFLENYLLKLDALYGCDQITFFTDANTYDNFRGSLGESYVPKLLNRRYLVSRMVARGVFHPKLYMFTSNKKALIGITSANLTREGISSNLEIMAIFEVSEREPQYAPLLRNCVHYAYRLAELSQCQSAINQVEAFNEICGGLISQNQEESSLQFVHNLDQSIFEQFVDYLSAYQVIRFEILSPFFDRELQPLKALHSVFPDAAFDLLIQQKRTNFPINAFTSLGIPVNVKLFKDIPRYMHGKVLIAHCAEGIIVLAGSANFTSPALLETTATGNFETGVIGPVEQLIANELLMPSSYNAEPIGSAKEIEATDRPEFDHVPKQEVDYLLDATLQDNVIHFVTRLDVSPEVFHPAKYELIDFGGSLIEGALTSKDRIQPAKKDLERLKGTIGVQLLGRNSSDQPIVSNLVWIVNLEVRTRDQERRRLNRIYSNPAELFEILKEFYQYEDDRELMLFLQKFDIPLDLILPPRLAKAGRNIKSQGNLVGMLPLHKGGLFSLPVLEAYQKCLDRLVSKLKRHQDNLQPEKMPNFILIYSSTVVLIDFVSSWVAARFQPTKLITNEDWRLVRECYEMLLGYSSELWQLVWGENGYRNAVNAKLIEARAEEGAELDRVLLFEEILLAEYDGSAIDLTEHNKRPIEQFRMLMSSLQIQTPMGTVVKPMLFNESHPHLEPPALQSLERRIDQLQAFAA